MTIACIVAGLVGFARSHAPAVLWGLAGLGCGTFRAVTTYWERGGD